MDRQTNGVRLRPAPAASLDDTDRRLLGLLAKDATRSYAVLGALLNLSPPAVHERAKRLKRSGMIRGTVAVLDGPGIGRPLLAFVQVTTEGWGKNPELLTIAELPEVEEIHSVTGKTCMLMKVRTRDTQDLEDLLARIYRCPGVRGTNSIVVLSTFLERGPQCAAPEAIRAALS